MNSAVQLALMSKAKKVFGAEDTFLSFPVSPLPYSKRQLDFFAQQDANQTLENVQAFSTLVNLIPSDEAWLPTEMRFLWDVYEQVLKEAEFASSTRTPEEETAYQQALAYLRVAGESGVWGDSAPVKAYRQHKDAYVVAQEKYRQAELTAKCATDPNEQQQWRDLHEPALRAELDDLQARWIIAGHKDEVEAAQSKVISLGAKSPLQTWADWNSRFNRDINTLTGATNNFTFFPSIFSPSNALEEGAWRPFKLSEQEIKALLNEAPAEMRARFAAESAASSMTSLTCEFSSAAVLRPWFSSEAFRARFWRFADPSRIISDGGKPPEGACPAYVTAIVFARKVKLEERRADSATDLKPFDGFRFTVAVKDPERLTKISPNVLIAAQPRPLSVTTPTMNVRPTEVISPRTANIAVATPRPMRPPAMNVVVGRPVAAQPLPARSLSNLNAIAVTRLPQRAVAGAAPTAPAPSPPQASPPTTTDDAIYILAFICKAVPKSPDPDLSLQW
jgi:hypothetical protein